MSSNIYVLYKLFWMACYSRQKKMQCKWVIYQNLLILGSENLRYVVHFFHQLRVTYSWSIKFTVFKTNTSQKSYRKMTLLGWCYFNHVQCNIISDKCVNVLSFHFFVWKQIISNKNAYQTQRCADDISLFDAIFLAFFPQS